MGVTATIEPIVPEKVVKACYRCGATEFVIEIEFKKAWVHCRNCNLVCMMVPEEEILV